MEGKEVEFSPKDKILDRQHIIRVIKDILVSLKKYDAVNLKDLSNQTIHCATCNQDAGSIAIGIIAYTLSKIVEREDYKKIKLWDDFLQKFNSFMNLAIKAAEEDNLGAFEEHIVRARKSIISAAPNMKNYLEETLRKAAINKAGKIYEHGLSLGQTAKILGVSEWEITEYAGQSRGNDYVASTLSVKQRAKMALEFLS